jgi:regulator of sirC expression with transglutaminase-like and TPR domain
MRKTMADKYPNDTDQQRTYRAFEALIAGEDATIDLAQAALLIASIKYADLDIAHYQAQLDALARRVRSLLALSDIALNLPSDLHPLKVIDALNVVLFDEEHFNGNVEDYYSLNNSFLNKVLDDHTGIPITLSLLYMEVAKRVGIQIDGIGLPYHFVVRCLSPEGPIYIDPFDNGQILSEADCTTLIRRLARNKVKLHAHWFEPLTRKQILARMLSNLKQIYINAEEFEYALVVCDLKLLLTPNIPTEICDRGLLHLQLKHYARALHDLKTYLNLSPQAKDRYEIINHIKSIRQIMAMMN